MANPDFPDYRGSNDITDSDPVSNGVSGIRFETSDEVTITQNRHPVFAQAEYTAALDENRDSGGAVAPRSP